MRQEHISSRRLPLVITSLFLAALAAHGQAIPEGGVLGIRAPVLDPPPGIYEQFDPHVAAAPDGGWTVFWASFYNGDGGGHLRSRLTTRTVSPAGRVGELRVIDETDSIDGPIGPISAKPDGDGWWLGWANFREIGTVARSARVTADGSLSGVASHGDTTEDRFFASCPITLPFESGGRLVAWDALSQELGRSWIEVQIFDAAGFEVGEPLRLGEESTTEEGPNSRCPQGIVQANGIRSIAWPTANDSRIGVTEFLATGELSLESLGDRGVASHLFVLTRRPNGQRFFAFVGAVPGANPPRLRLSEVDEKGVGRVVAEVPISASRGTQLFALRTDDNGNVAALWRHLEGPDVAFLSLFNSALVPQGQPVTLPRREATLGFGGDGDLLAAWVQAERRSLASGHFVHLLRAQRFRVQRDDDACIFRRNLFQCDTAGNGGAFEAQHRLVIGLAAGDQPLLADIDGDGRKDPCVFRSSNPSIPPLLLCDPRHDGTVLSMPLPFGVPHGTRVAYAQLDGDGREDFCHFETPLWFCYRSAGPPFTVTTFGRSNWQPLLADFDGDGIDNFCEYLDGRFACDLGNDGGPADFRVNLPRSILPGPLPAIGLAGDFDGDGRDEAAVWANGQLVWGSPPATGGLITTIRFRSLGTAADTPLLGDLDHS